MAEAAAQTEHRAVVDGRTAAFGGDRQARAALSAWLLDGADILRRCRVGDEVVNSCRSSIAYVAMEAIIAFDKYRGICADPLEYAELGRWVERELAEAEARR